MRSWTAGQWLEWAGREMIRRRRDLGVMAADGEMTVAKLASIWSARARAVGLSDEQALIAMRAWRLKTSGSARKAEALIAWAVPRE